MEVELDCVHRFMSILHIGRNGLMATKISLPGAVLTAEGQNQVKGGSSLDSRSISSLVIHQIATTENETLLRRLERDEKQSVCLSVRDARGKSSNSDLLRVLSPCITV